MTPDIKGVLHGATIHGDVSEIEDLLAEKITIAFGKNRRAMDWHNASSTIADFLDAITNHQVGKKDGAAFVQGELVSSSGKKGTQRLANNVKALEILVLDMDTGQPIEEVRERIIDAGHLAVIYTTHSHLGTVTDIQKQDVIKKMRLDDDEEVTLAHVRKYLEVFKKYHKTIVSSLYDLSEDHVEGGVKIFVKHSPMPKYRIVFFLDKRFVVATAAKTQRDAIELWKRKYAGLANSLDAFYDRSCVDPSRLFYLPRHDKGRDFHVELIVGDTLDLNEINDGNANGPSNVSGENAFLEVGKGEDTVTKNSWVKYWWFRNKDNFMAADFAESYYDVRARKSNDKVCVICPNDDAHSDAGNPDDTGFFCQNAGADGEDRPAMMMCMHASCINQFGDLSRSSYPYLDLMVTDMDLKEEDLDQYLMEFSETNEAPDLSDVTGKGATKAEKPPELTDDEYDALSLYDQFKYDIKYMKKDESAKEKMLRSIIKATKEDKPENRLSMMYVEELSNAMATHFSVSKAAMKKEFVRSKSAYEREETEENAEDTEVNVTSDFNVMVESTAKAIRKANSPPRLFKMEDGQTLVRINYTPKAGDASKHILDRTAIFAELSTLVKFFKPAGEGGRTRNVAAPPDIVSYYQGVSPAMLPLPTLSRVVYHPIFSADGDYHSKDGYDISTSAFLDMTIRAPRLPKVVTEDDLLDAWEWLFARPDQTEVNDERCGLFGEFPFHDDEDPDGHSSRINWLACMIQPLVRDMIDGPTPMHLIDKPTAGSGSSLMATLVNTVLTGNQISMAQYKNNADEFEKALVSKLLKSSDGFMYYDNVNSRVDNGALASAITAGVFSGRLLGQSKELSIPIRHVWLISGNNVSFSSEMIRRLIPTRIDPKLTNPEERKNFRIKHPERWANQHREDLLWALCIFVKNWIDKGMKPGSKSLGSFEAWAGIMSGIFEAADIPEMHADMFLENINTYKAVLNSDSDADVSLLTAILDDFGDKPFTTGEIFEMLWDDDARDLEGVSIPLNGTGNKNKMKQSFGYYVRRIRDRVYTIDQDENGNKINAMIVMSGKDAKTRSPRYRIEKIRA